MKTTLLASLAFVALSALPCNGQNTADKSEATMVEPFTGQLAFHQKNGRVAYNVVVTNGLVTGGCQQLLGSDEPIAKLVGGWYDHRAGRLSLLVQGTAENLDPKWVSQIQQFRVDPKTGEITLEHMLHGYGLTVADPDLEIAHVIDSLEGRAHLLGGDGAKAPPEPPPQ